MDGSALRLSGAFKDLYSLTARDIYHASRFAALRRVSAHAIIPHTCHPSSRHQPSLGGSVRIALWLLAALASLAFLYWLIVVGEATYLGRYAVRFIYQHGARFYDAARQSVTASDEYTLLPLLHMALVGMAAPHV